MLAKFPITVHILKGRKRALSLWAAALAGVVTMYAGLYPFIEGLDMEALVANLPDGISEALGYDQIGTAAGYVSSSVFGLLGPILLLVFGIGLGAKLIAGNEEDGTLELELTGPTSRSRIYFERYESMLISLFALSVAILVTLMIINALAGLEIAVRDMVVMSLALLLFTVALSSVSFAVGAATGRRVIALGAAAGIAFTAFMFDAVGPTINQDWMTTASPWSWYIKDSPLLGNANWLNMGLLAGLAVVSAVIGLAMFKKRDLMV
jgi:ABC-2 type transport system permease protein